MRRGFTAIESLCMLATLFVFAWLCLGILHKQRQWPFTSQKAAAQPAEKE